MKIQENARDNTLWIEITDQKGFLVFGDLSIYQRARGTSRWCYMWELSS